MDIILEFATNNWVSIIGAIIGLVFLYLEYKANVWMWAASIVMAAFYIYIFYKTGLYASAGIYIYFFIASIYGWVMWVTRNRNEETGREVITHVGKQYVVPIVVSIIGIFLMIYWVLSVFSDNFHYIALGDAATTSLNIVALWMISRKWAEQWLLLIPANLISSVLLFVQQDVMSGCLFVVYFAVSIFGYRKWKSMIQSVQS